MDHGPRCPRNEARSRTDVVAVRRLFGKPRWRRTSPEGFRLHLARGLIKAANLPVGLATPGRLSSRRTVAQKRLLCRLRCLERVAIYDNPAQPLLRPRHNGPEEPTLNSQAPARHDPTIAVIALQVEQFQASVGRAALGIALEMGGLFEQLHRGIPVSCWLRRALPLLWITAFCRTSLEGYTFS